MRNVNFTSGENILKYYYSHSKYKRWGCNKYLRLLISLFREKKMNQRGNNAFFSTPLATRNTEFFLHNIVIRDKKNYKIVRILKILKV